MSSLILRTYILTARKSARSVRLRCKKTTLTVSYTSLSVSLGEREREREKEREREDGLKSEVHLMPPPERMRTEKKLRLKLSTSCPPCFPHLSNRFDDDLTRRR
jgi:hypothetical protein